MTFGDRLRQLRVEKRLTQAQVAQRLGLTKSVVSAYETGLRSPAYDVLIRLCGMLGVTTDYLLGVEDTRTIRLDGLTDQESALITEMVEVLRAAKGE